MSQSVGEEQYQKALAYAFPVGTMCWYCGQTPATPGCGAAQSLSRRTDFDRATWMKTYEILAVPVPRCQGCHDFHARGSRWLFGTWVVGFVLITAALLHYVNWAASGLFGAFLSMILAFIVSIRVTTKPGVRSFTKESTYRSYPPVAARLAEGGWALSNREADTFPKPG